MRKRLAAAALLVLSHFSVQCGHGSEPALRKAEDGFEGMLLLVRDMGEFEAQLRQHGARAFNLVTHPRRGEPFTAAVLFSRCSPRAGTCSVRIDWTVVAPDGSPYGSQADQAACSNCEAPVGGKGSLAETSLNIVIEQDDPKGDYQVIARLRDLHSGSSVELTTGFTVVD